MFTLTASGESGFPEVSTKDSWLLHSPSSGNPADRQPKRKRKKSTMWVIGLFLFFEASLGVYVPVPLSTYENFNMAHV